MRALGHDDDGGRAPSMPTVVVGVDRRPASHDALAMGEAVVDPLHAELLLVHVYPHDPLGDSGALGAPPISSPRSHAEELLRQMAASTARPVRTVAVAHLSPVRGLHAVAAREHALLLAVGSSHYGGLGRGLLGHSERTVRHAPCPAGVAPHGLADRQWRPRASVVGTDGSDRSKEARDFAERIAAETGAQLSQIAVEVPLGAAVEPYRDPPDWRLADELQRATVDQEPNPFAGVLSDTQVKALDPVEQLIAVSHQVDLLVLAGNGPRRVFRDAACPVIVVPHAGHGGRHGHT